MTGIDVRKWRHSVRDRGTLSQLWSANIALMPRSVILAIGFLLGVPVLAFQAPSPATVQPDVIDKILSMVGPSEPNTLTEKKRFQLYLVNTVGPIPIFGEALAAGISQWGNRPEEWGQGWNAYGKRFANNVAYNGVRQSITYGTSVLFHEDNRYFASHKQGFWPRTGYAVLSTITARRPGGGRSLSVSSVAGVIGASTSASFWGPRSWRGAGNISVNAAFSFGATAGFNVVREFLPDLLQRPHR